MSTIPGALPHLEQIQRDRMPDTCDLLQRTETRTARGGARPTYAVILAGSPCRIVPAGPAEDAVAGRTSEVDDVRVLLPLGTTIGHADRLRAGGVDYSILGVVRPRSYETAVELRCRRIR